MTCIASDNWLRTKDEKKNFDLFKDEKSLEVKDNHLESLMTNKLEINLTQGSPSLKSNEDELQSDQNDNNENSITSESDDAKPKRSRRKNTEKTHMCTVCGKTFFTSGHLRSHELTHKNSKDFTCHSCGKKFLMKSYLNRHMKSHLNERSYKCKICEKGFNTSTTLSYHIRLVHSGKNKFNLILKIFK